MTWLQIRVELRDTAPAIWRELLVPADLPLPELHHVLQAAMGWQNSHLHSFAPGGTTHWQSRPHWVMDDPEGILDRAETDLPESEATVGAVLPAAGAQATYLYDFGDDWEHLLTLTDVLDGDAPAVADLTSPVLTDGEGVCPPEDCGGVPGHAELLASVDGLEAGDELDEWSEQKLRWAFGTLDAEQIRAQLTFDLARQQVLVAALGQPLPPLHPLLAEMMAVVPGSLRDVVVAADLGAEAGLTARDAAQLTDNLRWFLDAVGDDGVELTSAGNLRPALVRQVADRLQLGQEWIGALNREDQTPGVAHFRELVTALGLVRKYKGTLLLTKVGAALRSDPVALLAHVAGRLPLGKAEYVRQASLLVMVDLLGGPESRSATMTRCAAILTELGWRAGNDELSEWDVYHQVPETRALLLRCGVLVAADPDGGWSPADGRWTVTDAGAAFLRRVLRGGPFAL